MPEAQEAFPSEDSQWFLTDRKFYRVAREPMRGAPALVTFSAVDRPELVEDFLKPPADPGTKGVARFRYPDRSGATKVYDWPLEGQEGKSVTLPDSDLTVSLIGDRALPDPGARPRPHAGRGPDPDRAVQDPEGRRRAGHAHGAGEPADGPEPDPVAGRGGGPPAPAGGDPLHGRADDRPPGQPAASARSTSSPWMARAAIRACTIGSTAGARRAGPSCDPPGRSHGASRSSPSAATRTCR